MTRRGIAAITVGAILLSTAGLAVAHWCSNIFASPARFVVKPERSTVFVSSAGTKFRVYLQNNWPYKLENVAMRGTASGYTITVSPSGQDILPGQNVSYMFTISGPAGNKGTSTMNLQVDFRLGSWRSESDCMVSQSPSQSMLIDGATTWTSNQVCNITNQTPSLSAATLADKYPSATLPTGAPFFGRTGLEQLIHWFGYPFCYNVSSGDYLCGSQKCPDDCAEGSPNGAITTWTQNLMRAGAEVAVRKSKLGSLLADARAKAVNAIKHGSDQHMCLGAVVGGYLWQGVASPNAFTNMLGSSPMPSQCEDAGWRAFNGTKGSSCSSSWSYERRAACAAAEGLRNNNGPVVAHLVANAGDGASGGNAGLYYSYMLYIVQGYRKASTGYVPFYPDAGAPTTDGAAPAPDLFSPPDTTPWPDTKPPADTKPWPTPDTKPPADTKPWPTPDTKPPADTKPWPTPDKGVEKDTRPWPTPDGPVVADQSVDDASHTDDMSMSDARASEDGPTTPTEGGTLPDTGGGHGQNRTLDGGCGCEVGAVSDSSWPVLALLLGLMWVWWRRRSK